MPLAKIREGSVDLIEKTGNKVLKLPRTEGRGVKGAGKH